MKFKVYSKLYGSEGYQSNGSEPFRSAYKAPIRIRAYMSRESMICLGRTHYRIPFGGNNTRWQATFPSERSKCDNALFLVFIKKGR